MRKTTVVLLLAVLLGLAGCSPAANHTQQTEAPKNKQTEVTLYYANADNTGFVTEKKNITYTEKDNIYKMALQELLKGPSAEDAYLRVPKDAEIKDVKFSNGTVNVDISGFTGFKNDSEETIARASVVNTLTSLEGVNKVAITVDGKDYADKSGNTVGAMKHMDKSDIKTYKIYFSDEQALNLVPEKRTIADEAKPAQGIVQELIKGPEYSSLIKTIPDGTKLISLEIKDSVAYVNLSKEFKENNGGGSTGETMALYSVIDSLTQLPEIEKVQFLIEGNKTDTLAGHYDISQPMGKDTSMIKED
jgi:germination protein M